MPANAPTIKPKIKLTFSLLCKITSHIFTPLVFETDQHYTSDNKSKKKKHKKTI